VTLPFFNPGRRSVTYSLLLLLAFVVLLLTGLGVFRLYFEFDWMGAESGIDGQLFSLKIRGGNSFNLFFARELGSAFWTTQFLILMLVVVMPLFRPVGAAVLALAASIGIFFVNLESGLSPPVIPVEFSFLTVGVLLILYVLTSYQGEMRDRRKFTSLMSQYVPPELATQYSRNPESMGMQGEQRDVSVLFCDVIGFSALTENMDPKTVARWLNSYFSAVSKIIVLHSGTIDKYIGDSVMAFWGAPANSSTHAHDALAAALDIQREIDTLNSAYEVENLPPIQVGIGISTGPVNVGNLGSEYRMAYTVVGDTVNVAQHVEEQTRLYEVPIVVAGETAEVLPDMLFRELDTVRIKGRSKAVRMFEPLGRAAEVSEQTNQYLREHRKAMRATKAGQWDIAEELFTHLKDDWGPEAMYARYLRGITAAKGSKNTGNKKATSGKSPGGVSLTTDAKRSKPQSKV